jgi:hypothetical protein
MNKTDHHDITEILLKVALNSINPHIYSGQQWKIKKVLFIKKTAFVENGINNTNRGRGKIRRYQDSQSELPI